MNRRIVKIAKALGFEWSHICSANQQYDQQCPRCQTGRLRYVQPKWKWRIPKGDYCYKFTGKSGYNVDVKYWMGTKYCPYYNIRIYDDISLPHCDYLDMGSIPNNLTDGEWDRLITLFGSEKAVWDSKANKLLLLWDGCKECGIKEDDHDEDCNAI